MGADLVLTVLHDGSEGLGSVAAFDATGDVVVATETAVLASADGNALERRGSPRIDVRGVLGAGDAIWACGDHGRLSVSRDRGATWSAIDSGANGCLRGLARASDGAVWVVGDGGFAARLIGGHPARVDLGTTAVSRRSMRCPTRSRSWRATASSGAAGTTRCCRFRPARRPASRRSP